MELLMSRARAAGRGTAGAKPGPSMIRVMKKGYSMVLLVLWKGAIRKKRRVIGIGIRRKGSVVVDEVVLVHP